MNIISNYSFEIRESTLTVKVETQIPCEGVGALDGPEDMSDENLKKMADIVKNNLCTNLILIAESTFIPGMSSTTTKRETPFPLSENFVRCLNELPTITSCTLKKPWNQHCPSRYAHQQKLEAIIESNKNR